jgi:hypothetical protein
MFENRVLPFDQSKLKTVTTNKMIVIADGDLKKTIGQKTFNCVN